MPSKELILWIAAVFGLPLVFLISAFLLLSVYPNLRLIISDILAIFGGLGKWAKVIRRGSIGARMEGTLNKYVVNYNKEFVEPFLPQCEIEWVTPGNQGTLIKPGKVIVKLSFSNDRDRNIYNAAMTFVRGTLIRGTKPFLSANTSRALDLLVTRNLLLETNRQALDIFNERFSTEDESNRDTFYKLEEIDEEGLFKRILLQEYHYLGQRIGGRAPRAEHSQEADSFRDWLHDLATRESSDKTDLKFDGKYIRVGVILVASDDTYSKYGIDPYLRRANQYAADSFQIIYLLSRGHRRSKVTRKIANELESTAHFQQLTKKPNMNLKTVDGSMLVTCIPMAVDIEGLQNFAWAKLESSFETKVNLIVRITAVSDESVEVDAYGLRFDIDNADLTELDIVDARRYFSVGQELIIAVLEVDRENDHTRLSNKSSETDPQKLIEEFKNETDEPRIGTVRGHSVVGGWERAMFVEFHGNATLGFVPRQKATFSRFLPISEKYPVGTSVSLRILSFDPTHATYRCEVVDLPDPWENLANYSVGNNYPAFIRQINERYLICDLEEGIEGSISFEEASWGTREEQLRFLKGMSVGEKIFVKLVEKNVAARWMRLSIKRATPTEAELIFPDIQGFAVNARVSKLVGTGAEVVLIDSGTSGFLPRSEIDWVFCSNPAEFLHEGDELSVKVIGYDDRFDSIRVSRKAQIQNDFLALFDELKVGQKIHGEITGATSHVAVVSLLFDDGKKAVGYVHKSEITALAFVNGDDIQDYLPIGMSCEFLVKSNQDNFQIVELSRKLLFQSKLDSLQYGKAYSGHIARVDASNAILQGADFEGKLTTFDKGLDIGTKIEVILARRGNNPRDVEFDYSR